MLLKPQFGTPIARVSLHKEVTARLRDMIAEGHFKAGERIPEVEVAKALGVSRTPLREALKVIANEGVVELLPLQGAVVKAFTRKDVRDMLDLMGVLEEHAGRLAVAASEEEIVRVAELHERMRGHFKRRERIEYFNVNHEIHNAIIAATHNESLSMLHGMLRARSHRVRYMGINQITTNSRENWTNAWQEHEEMIIALKARSGVKLSRVMRRHWENTWLRISSVMLSEEDSI